MTTGKFYPELLRISPICSMEFWSQLLGVIIIREGATPIIGLPSIVVELPDGVSVFRAILKLKFRAISALYVGGMDGGTPVVSLDGDQLIQIQNTAEEDWHPAITLPDGMLRCNALSPDYGRDVGYTIDGDVELVGDGLLVASGDFVVRWTDARASDDFTLRVEDLQTCLQVWFKQLR